LVGAIAGLAGSARAQFVPGRVYISEPPADLCGSFPGLPNDRIWEIDPQTGQVSLFVELSDELCGYLNGLAFTPDATGLRASNFFTNSILQFDGSANASVALNAADGINEPLGGNNIAYDAASNFYVENAGSTNILRFPADGGPATVFADVFDGVTGAGPIAFAPNGDLYLGNELGQIWRVGPDGSSSLFDSFVGSSGVLALTTDMAGNLFALGTGGVYRYQVGNPDSQQLIAPFMNLSGQTSMTMSPNQDSVYFAAGIHLYEIDAVTGAVSLLATLPVEGPLAGSGIAVYVPEPAGLALILCGILIVRRPRRSGVRPGVSNMPAPECAI
jgi:hypothetical protein